MVLLTNVFPNFPFPSNSSILFSWIFPTQIERQTQYLWPRNGSAFDVTTSLGGYKPARSAILTHATPVICIARWCSHTYSYSSQSVYLLLKKLHSGKQNLHAHKSRVGSPTPSGCAHIFPSPTDQKPTMGFQCPLLFPSLFSELATIFLCLQNGKVFLALLARICLLMCQESMGENEYIGVVTIEL